MTLSLFQKKSSDLQRGRSIWRDCKSPVQSLWFKNNTCFPICIISVLNKVKWEGIWMSARSSLCKAVKGMRPVCYSASRHPVWLTNHDGRSRLNKPLLSPEALKLFEELKSPCWEQCGWYILVNGGIKGEQTPLIGISLLESCDFCSTEI